MEKEIDQKLLDDMNELTKKGLLHLSLFIQWLEENLREDELMFLKGAAEYHIEKVRPCAQTAVLAFFIGYLETQPATLPSNNGMQPTPASGESEQSSKSE